MLFDAAKDARKRKRGETTAALKNPQDYLKPILAKQPDRVKGIRAGERVRTLEDIQPSRCEGHLACLCAPVGIGFCVAVCTRLAGLRCFVPDIL